MMQGTLSVKGKTMTSGALVTGDGVGADERGAGWPCDDNKISDGSGQ